MTRLFFSDGSSLPLALVTNMWISDPTAEELLSFFPLSLADHPRLYFSELRSILYSSSRGDFIHWRADTTASPSTVTAEEPVHVSNKIYYPRFHLASVRLSFFMSIPGFEDFQVRGRDFGFKGLRFSRFGGSTRWAHRQLRWHRGYKLLNGETWHLMKTG